MGAILVQSFSVERDGQAKSSSCSGEVDLGTSAGSIQKHWALVQRAKLLFLCLGVSLLVGLANGGSVFGQDQLQLPAELKPALDAINKRSVTATINFLASDEMRGRDTPSRELTIASAYVAARFKAAGLTGLGEKGSFYRATQIATTAAPQTGVIFSDGKEISHYGLLSAGAEAMSFDGSVVALSGKENRDVTFDCPITFVADEFKSPRDQSNFNRRLARYRGKGATAILVQVEPDHLLVGAAKRASRPKLVQTRRGLLGQVLLVPKMEFGRVVMELPKRIDGKSTVRNVVGVLRGSDPELLKEAIIITAHLDHIGEQGVVGDTVCNGADDNASGVTAVVTLADAFGIVAAMNKQASPLKRSVIFMTFWGEEKGLLGSRQYVKNPAWPLDKTICNINIEMIGRPEPGGNEKAWVTGWEKSDLGKIMNEGSQKIGVLIFNHPQFGGEMLYRASDNFPFVEKGVIAHSFSAGSLHGDYHQVTDHIEKLELRHMNRVIQGLFAGSLRIAQGKATPAKSK